MMGSRAIKGARKRTRVLSNRSVVTVADAPLPQTRGRGWGLGLIPIQLRWEGEQVPFSGSKS